MAISGVRFLPLKLPRHVETGRLPLAAAWPRGSCDPIRDDMLSMLDAKLRSYAKDA
jgi:hypothetical protein